MSKEKAGDLPTNVFSGYGRTWQIYGLDNPYIFQDVEFPPLMNKHCAKYNDSDPFSCIECEYKTFFNNNKTDCVFCSILIPGCDYCNDDGKCLACSKNYILQNEKCISNFICTKNKYPNEDEYEEIEDSYKERPSRRRRVYYRPKGKRKRRPKTREEDYAYKTD